MPTLLVQSCSKSKSETDDPIPAIDLYAGYFYKIIKKAIREDDIDPDLDICILSAKHGLIDPDTRLNQYDQKMDVGRAKEIRKDVRNDLIQRINSGTYSEVLINMGGPYREAIQGFESEVSVPVETIDGRLGERGRQLKHRIRQSSTTSVLAD